MARQPLILLVGLSLLGCRDDELYEGAFDLPVGADVLETANGPFTEPIALVANGHGGQIATLALKQGRFLTDDPSASYLRGNWIPTGGNRVLSSVAIWAPDRFDVQAFAGDRAYGQLVQVPWIVGSEVVDAGDSSLVFPIEEGPTWGEDACFLPAGSTWTPDLGTPCPGEPWDALRDVEVKHGYTATETWTLTWRASRGTWVVEGSRSGRQADEVTPGVRYKATKRRVGFTAVGKPAALNDGDRVVFTTSNGLIEHDVGGSPEAIAMAPDHSLLALIVHDVALDAPVVRWFDPASSAVVGEVGLDAGSVPVRMHFDVDGALWIADAGTPTVWEVAPGSTTATPHPLPWPILDVAPLFGDQRRLFVVPDDGREVWVFDADTDEALDVNPHVPGAQGMFFGSPVTGITPIPLAYTWPQTREIHREKRLEGRSVAVALHSGQVVFMEEETGCLVQDFLGPRTLLPQTLTSSGDVQANFEIDNGPVMVGNAHNDRRVVVSACSGIARDDSWRVRFDGTVGAWRVRSTTLGDQEGLAYEDQRYISDLGEVSFTIRAGAVPSQDGWEFSFGVDDGALSATGDQNGDGQRETILGAPGDPVFFHYLAGRDEEVDIDWQSGAIQTVDGKTDRAYVLLPSTGADNVARINPETGGVEVRWD